MKLEDEAAEDRFMMSDSLKDLVGDVRPSQRRSMALTIVTPSQEYAVMGRLNGIKHSMDSTELIVQLAPGDQMGLISDPPEGEAHLHLDASPVYSYDGQAEVTSVDATFLEDSIGLKISFRRLPTQTK